VLLGGPAAAAVNAPIADGPDAEVLRPFVDLAYRMGKLYPQLSEQAALPAFTLVMQGKIAALDSEPVANAFLSGFLQMTTDRRVSIVNARSIAAELGVRVDIRGDEGTTAFSSSLRVACGSTSLTGTYVYGGPRIVAIDGFEVDAIPNGPMLITRHHDVPGMIGKVGTILGTASINISTMQVSRVNAGGEALMILATDRRVEIETLEQLRAIAGVESVRALEI
jgi:D-3-phosphoglycerate dehydrogenase